MGIVLACDQPRMLCMALGYGMATAWVMAWLRHGLWHGLPHGLCNSQTVVFPGLVCLVHLCSLHVIVLHGIITNKAWSNQMLNAVY